MKIFKKKSVLTALVTLLLILGTTMVAFATGDEAPVSNYFATFWAMIPPLVAIALALITKEVYSSLFIGILAGGLLATKFNPIHTVGTVVNDGFISAVSGSAGIFIFLVILGIIVALLN